MIKSFLVVSFQILRVFRGRKFWKISNSNNNLEKSCTEIENREFKNITTLEYNSSSPLRGKFRRSTLQLERDGSCTIERSINCKEKTNKEKDAVAHDNLADMGQRCPTRWKAERCACCSLVSAEFLKVGSQRS